jgi:hypothetical protein
VGGRVTAGVILGLAFIGDLVETKAPDGPYFEASIIHHIDCGSAWLAEERNCATDSRSAPDTTTRRWRISRWSTHQRRSAWMSSAFCPIRASPAYHGVRPRLRRGHRAGHDDRRASLTGDVRRGRTGMNATPKMPVRIPL